MLNDIEIKIPEPKWGSNLTGIILKLEKLRSNQSVGEVPKWIFLQLKDIFQILETFGSARIEGNNTTLSEYVEKIIEKSAYKDESQKEIENLDEAIKWIEDQTDENTKFTRAYISEVHKIITKELTPPPHGEGSMYPGELRKHNVHIKKSSHIPPDAAALRDHFDSFLNFINQSWPEQYQLLMIAIAHHRFAYIHPFDNGNGRMGRLLNYALLIKIGFRVKDLRIINPSSIFYNDREKYYNFLSRADSLKDEDLLQWSEYFLSGLKDEIEKIDHFLVKKYVQQSLLLPAISFSLDRKQITDREYQILKYLILKDDMTMKSEELKIFGITNSVQKSRTMSRMKEKNMIKPIETKERIYTINFANNYLLRGIIKSLESEKFIPEFLNKNENRL
ncbi:Fic family protein [Athalassotoga saccharophila]|uniref:Fic family protein n=1 Tax=Athalassotoga saccharophila TaxID=1441386 RepID=UPI00137B2F02|nr:Fic family protein [Athalassotoga saccharophila]BBJ27624.1 fic domain protein [Athalassotoga saccharophila]